MKHLTEDDLVLYRYSEAVPHRRAEIDAHLRECSACRVSYQALDRVLAAVAAAPVPERDEQFGAEVWRQIEPRLGQPTREEPARKAWWADWFRQHRWVEAGAMAALLVAAFLAGRFWRPSASDPSGTPPQTVAVQSGAQVRERILLVTVGEHLERSQMVLVELVNSGGRPGEAVDISAERQWAEELVDSNRLYRQTATGRGNTRVAAVLDELERALLEIAHSPSRLNSGDFDALRQRIESQGILFKVRVLGSQLKQEPMPQARQNL